MDDDWRSRLRQLLDNQNKSLRRLSVEMGNSPDYAKKLLQQQNDPSVKNFFAIAEALGVCPVWLYTGTQDQLSLSDLTPGQRGLVAQLVAEFKQSSASVELDYRQLSEGDQEIVRSMIASLKDKHV